MEKGTFNTVITAAQISKRILKFIDKNDFKINGYCWATIRTIYFNRAIDLGGILCELRTKFKSLSFVKHRNNVVFVTIRSDVKS